MPNVNPSLGDVVSRFEELFDPFVHRLIETLASRISAIDPKIRPYVTDSDYWLCFQIGPKPEGRRGRPFVRLVTPHKGKSQHTWLRIFLPRLAAGQSYDDPTGLVKVYYNNQPHIELYSEDTVEPAMHLINQAYAFKRTR